MTGLKTCARYAFAPNYFQYCGPDKNEEILAYLFSNKADPNLAKILADFHTLYGYLLTIASANKISDPFDSRVVEAYWLGNDLLNKVSPQETYLGLTENLKLAKKINKKELNWLLTKLPQGAKLTHSFHVFNVFTRTGHHTVQHTVQTMDSCRIGWGKVLAKENNKILVSTQQIIYQNKKLKIKKNIKKNIKIPLNNLNILTGDLITYHWNWYCDTVNLTQIKNLKFYTKFHLELANQTL